MTTTITVKINAKQGAGKTQFLNKVRLLAEEAFAGQGELKLTLMERNTPSAKWRTE